MNFSLDHNIQIDQHTLIALSGVISRVHIFPNPAIYKAMGAILGITSPSPARSHVFPLVRSSSKVGDGEVIPRIAPIAL
jgi:hypothetical protein